MACRCAATSTPTALRPSGPRDWPAEPAAFRLRGAVECRPARQEVQLALGFAEVVVGALDEAVQVARVGGMFNRVTASAIAGVKGSSPIRPQKESFRYPPFGWTPLLPVLGDAVPVRNGCGHARAHDAEPCQQQEAADEAADH